MRQNTVKQTDFHSCEEPILCPYCCNQYKTKWYFDFGQHHFRFFIGKVYGKWCFNVGLKIVDFGYAWDKVEALQKEQE